MNRILFIFLSAVALTVFGSGCSVHMWREGWAVRSSTIGVKDIAGHCAPVASKNMNGDIVFEHDVCLTQYGVDGTLGNNEKALGLKRITNTVSRTALQPITNIWLLNAGGFYPSGRNDGAFVQPGCNLPILRCKMESYKSWRYPPLECVVWDREYIWYVPPRDTNEMPMAAVLSRETMHTPVYLYPVKVVLFPICLVGDLFYVPIMYFFDR